MRFFVGLLVDNEESGETRIQKRLHCLPDGIGDWIFQASAEDLAACCFREKLNVGGRMGEKLQWLVDAWSPPPEGACTVRKGRAPVSSATNHLALARIRQSQRLVAELQQKSGVVEGNVEVRPEQDVALLQFPSHPLARRETQARHSRSLLT